MQQRLQAAILDGVWQLLSQAEKVLVEEQGMLPLLFYSSHNIVSTRIKGWEENVMDIHPSRFIRVAEQ